MNHRITCSWCHALNPAQNRWCHVCGHSAWLPRCECDCAKCVGVFSEQTPVVTGISKQTPPDGWRPGENSPPIPDHQ